MSVTSKASVRILHTSDWHLGKSLMTRSLLEDQARVLDQAMKAWQALAPRIVIIAGDVFDRAIAPEDAVRLLDTTLARLLEFTEHVILIPGNHDSAGRLGFASSLLKSRGLHVVSSPASALKPLELSPELDELVQIWAVPFLEPSEWRSVLGDEVRSHEDVQLRLNEAWREDLAKAKDRRRILITHAFIQGGLASDSERPLQIGGSETLPAASLEAFDYVALGHLHRPQTMSDDRLVYPGSLFPYSSSEASQDKGFRCIEISNSASARADRTLRHSFHAFAEQRRLRVHRGHFEDLLRGDLEGSTTRPGDAGADQPDYVVVLLEDSQLPFEAFRRLQQVFPALLHVSRAWKEADASTRTEQLRMKREMSEAELIGSFIAQYARQPVEPADQSWLLEELHEFLRAQEGHEAK